MNKTKMNYLIDTHIFIWSFLDSKRLNQRVSKIISDEENKIFLSSMSFWEMAIKNQSGKLNLQGINILQLPHIAKELDFEILNPDAYDFLNIGQIPLKENHHDPFDRMLIRQAIRNNLILISADAKFRQYEQNGLQLLW